MLIEGRGGVFKIFVDGKKIWSKKYIWGRFPREREITSIIKSLH
ncbi:MAG: hypothetical protein H8D45_07785 [Bacteroidetes bacterium]|nr:hypothetical protein [Bacteroidota bacterium]